MYLYNDYIIMLYCVNKLLFISIYNIHYIIENIKVTAKQKYVYLFILLLFMY